MKYNMPLVRNENDAVSMLLNRIAPQKTILEFGCANGRMTRFMQQELRCSVYIVEIEQAAFEEARQYAADGFCGDVLSFGWLERFKHIEFDYIIFADVLEHLIDPKSVLKVCKTLLKEDGHLLVSVPNVAHNDILYQLYNDRFNYTNIGLLDDTHIRFFAYESLQPFFEDVGFSAIFEDASIVDTFESEQNVKMAENAEVISLLSKRRMGNFYQFILDLQHREYVVSHQISKESKISDGKNDLLSKVYIDYGNGFYEEAVHIFKMPLYTDFCFRIALSPDVKALRFDPVKNKYCILRGLQVKGYLGALSPRAFNGVQVDDAIVFNTADPQILITPPEATRWVTISGRLVLLDEQQQNCFLDIFGDIPHIKEQNAALQQENRSLLKISDSLTGNFERQITDYSSRLADRESRLADCDARLRETTRQAQDSASELEAMTAYARQVEDMYHRLAAQYNTVIGSRCWRMTAPIRRILDWLKARKSARLVYKGLKYLRIFGFRETLKKTWRFLAGGPSVIDINMNAVTSFDDLTKQMQKNAVHGARLMYLPDVLISYDKNSGRKILLISHELNLTGAPVALRHFARCLKEAGYCPVILSHHEGNLAEVIASDGIPVMICPTLLTSDVLENFVGLFDLVVASTIVMAPVVSMLSGTDVPVLWWIHEAAASYVPVHMAQMPTLLAPNVVVRAGGTYARLLLEKHRPLYDVDDLLYYVPDFSDKRQADTAAFTLPAAAEGKKLFCLVGMIERRKGQDVLVDAVLQLSQEQLSASYFVFVGRPCYRPNHQKIMALCDRFRDNVLYIEELPEKKLYALYRLMDCLICASLDDPMPIVVTEAMQLSKLIICSENTGSAALLRQENSGLVYANNDPHELALNIIRVLEQCSQLDPMRNAARYTYEKYFSRAVFDGNVMALVQSMMQNNASREQRPARMGDSLTMAHFVEAYGKTCVPGDWFERVDAALEYDQSDETKRVLLVSHELSLTGAPIALLYLAESYLRQGVQVAVISPADGPLAEEFISKGIPAVVYTKLYQDDFLAAQSGKFDLIVLNTVVTYRAVNQLAHSKTPVLWWIHDSLASYQIGGFEMCMPHALPENVSVVCGGEYAREQLLKYYPDYSAGLFYYMVPDLAAAALQYPVYNMGKDPARTAFAVIGLQDTRKGHDIFAKAIELLTDEERARSQFYFIGRHLDEPIREAVDAICARYPEQVTYITEVNRQELFSVYLQIDCVVCSSKDDPLPVFITEAIMMSTLVICSEHTGSAPILEREQCGLVYHNNDPSELAEKMREVLNGADRLEAMRRRGRESYRKYFSREVFDDEAGRLLSHLAYVPEENSAHICVSVVIPAYNGGAQMEELLQRLRDQRGIRQIEIVVVDSGSGDGTPALCRQYGATVIEIPQAEFSHSYSRNLGALHAHGDILLFMTQDALPDDALWMRRVVEPILSGEATATSCMEQCPPETELYYSAASWYHVHYLGVDEGDRLSADVACKTFDELRAHASLNDVSTAIRKDVFSNYLYRFNYAEDLDLGLRLLKSGHAIKLLASAKVVHGHNRPAGYYIKRGLVECKALGKIYSPWSPPQEKEQAVASKLYHGEAILRRAMTQTYARSQGAVYELHDFFSLLLRQLQNAKDSGESLHQSIAPMPQRDPLLAWCVEVVRPYAGERTSREDELVNQCGYYLESSLLPFLERKNVRSLDAVQQAEVYDCLEKQFCLATGNLLARLDENTALFAELKTLTQGV